MKNNFDNEKLLKIRHSLAKIMALVVEQLFEGVKLGDVNLNEEGFYYDFDLPRNLIPTDLGQIEEKMKEIIKEMFAKGAFKLLHFSGVHVKGDSNGPMLQRIYATAWENEKELKSYLQKVEDAAKRDHRVLGTQMDYFSSSQDVGAGLVMWHPKGAMVRYLLEKFSQSAHIMNGYDWVYTPHIGKSQLWKTSGHLDFFKDSMYSPIEIDNEEYYLKPMSCPFHVLIYNNSLNSYRDLPVRYAEYATVYRYELSGALQGLTRVRGFTQDDAHIICTPQQAHKEVVDALKFSLYILKSFGLKDFKAYIATKPEKKSIGDEKDWNLAIESLKQAVEESGLDYDIDDGGGAFYGPKIDLKLKDSLGREWQCSTIQFDFNLPERFEMSYIGSDGGKHIPMMIHRALFGSLERFFAMLIEHYNGDFPLWFAPVQIGIVPISSCHYDYCEALFKKLKTMGYRVKADFGDEKMRSKIRSMEKDKIPLVFVIGDREVAETGISVRSRKEGDLGFMSLDNLLDRIKADLEQGIPRYILD